MHVPSGLAEERVGAVYTARSRSIGGVDDAAPGPGPVRPLQPWASRRPKTSSSPNGSLVNAQESLPPTNASAVLPSFVAGRPRQNSNGGASGPGPYSFSMSEWVIPLQEVRHAQARARARGHIYAHAYARAPVRVHPLAPLGVGAFAESMLGRCSSSARLARVPLGRPTRRSGEARRWLSR